MWAFSAENAAAQTKLYPSVPSPLNHLQSLDALMCEW